MSSSKLLSLCRLAFPPSRSTLLPPFKPHIRSLSNMTSPRQLPLTSDFPKVANITEITDSKNDLWLRSSGRALSEMANLLIANQSTPNPYSGRTVHVKKDVGDALRMLDGILSRNKVKYQLRMTERHEKKGYKRRRLASERWRNHFANEVRKKVQLVMKMRDRGA